MEIKKEKPKFKSANFEMKIFRDEEVLDLRTLEGSHIINQLEANIERRKSPIEKRLKKEFDVMK